MARQAAQAALLILLILGLVISGILFVFFVFDSKASIEKSPVADEPEYIFVKKAPSVPLVYDASNDPYPSTIYPKPRGHRNSNNSEENSLTQGLLAWFKFDEDANSNVFRDSSGEGNDLTCSGNACPTNGTGRNGRSATFDGFSTMLSADDDSSLHAALSVSIASWVYVTSIQGEWGTVVLKTDGLVDCRAPQDCSNREYGLWVRNNGGAEFDVTPVSRFGIGKVDCILPAGSVPFNQWAHIAGVANGADQTMKVYVNGNLIRTCSQPTLSSGIYNSNGPLMVGRSNANWGDLRIGLGGSIDDLRIYDRALTQDEVEDLA
jgi:hypothetical protein